MPPLGHVRARGRTGLGVPGPGPARPGLPGGRDGEGAGGGEIEDLIFVFPCIFVWRIEVVARELRFFWFQNFG